jgi:hypothetical protein
MKTAKGIALLLGALVLIALPLALALHGCGATAIQREATVANVSAQSFNAALPVVVQAYETDARAAIDRACCDRSAMEAARARVQRAWQPVRLAWEATRVAHDAWRVELERCRALADASSCSPTLPGLFANFEARLNDARCAVRALGRADLDPLPGLPNCSVPTLDGGLPDGT